jgi:RNA polymerase sigma-70 factor (ECF subfamily)
MRITAAMPRADVHQQPTRRETVRGEPELLRALAAGERAAGEALVERSYGKVWAALYRLTGGDSDLAGDLTQETFRKAWVSLAGFDGRAAFSTWLYRIAYNLFLNHLRRPRPVLATEHPSLDRGDPACGQDEAVLAAESAEQVRRAVLDLPEPLRLTVTARYWGELSSAEIAAVQGITAVAVRKRLRKAMKILGNALEVLS